MGGFDLTKGDLECLPNGEWLNDEVCCPHFCLLAANFLPRSEDCAGRIAGLCQTDFGVLTGHILFPNAHERASDDKSHDLVQVINAYMSLLALRSEARWAKLKREAQDRDRTKAKARKERCEEAESRVDENDGGWDVTEGKSSIDDDRRSEQMETPGEMERKTRSTLRGKSSASGGSDSTRSSGGKDARQEEGSAAGDPGRRSGQEEASCNLGDAEGSGGSPKRCAFFSSFFYALLRNAKDGYAHENVRRWSRKKVASPCEIGRACWHPFCKHAPENLIHVAASVLAFRHKDDSCLCRSSETWT